MIKTLAACAAMIAIVAGWGPLTHYDIGCQSLALSNTIIDCLQFQQENTKAMDLPDAFFFDSNQIQSSQCPLTLQALHNPLFASYAVQQAIQQKNLTNQNLALSFGSHIISDVAGFSTKYLSPTANVNWLYTWQFMLALDASIAHNWLSTGITAAQLSNVIGQINQPISQETAQWLASATEYYHTIDSTFPVINSSQAITCSGEWANAISVITQEAIQKPDSCFQQEITFYDPVTRNESNGWEKALQRFTLYRSCGIHAVRIWKESLVIKQHSPTVAVAEAIAYVYQCSHT